MARAGGNPGAQTPEYFVNFNNGDGFGGIRPFYAGQETEMQDYLAELRESGYGYEVKEYKKPTFLGEANLAVENFMSSAGDVVPTALRNIGKGIGAGFNAVLSPIVKGITSPLIVPALAVGGFLILLAVLKR